VPLPTGLSRHDGGIFHLRIGVPDDVQPYRPIKPNGKPATDAFRRSLKTRDRNEALTEAHALIADHNPQFASLRDRNRPRRTQLPPRGGSQFWGPLPAYLHQRSTSQPKPSRLKHAPTTLPPIATPSGTPCRCATPNTSRPTRPSAQGRSQRTMGTRVAKPTTARAPAGLSFRDGKFAKRQRARSTRSVSSACETKPSALSITSPCNCAHTAMADPSVVLGF